MGTPRPISFGDGSNKAEFGLEGAAEFVNAYIKDLGDGTKTGFTARAINGTEAFATLTDGTAVRAMLALEDRLLAIAGRTLYSVPFAGATPTLIDGLGVDGFATMERNRRTSTQTVIVINGAWWYYQDGILTEGADPDLSPPIFVIQKDGYFIFGHATGKWSISGIDDITVSGLDFTEAESNADGLIMGAVRGPDVLLFGAKSLEFWQNTGAADFPFTRSMALNVGCWCAGSVAKVIVQVQKTLVDSVIWAATDDEGAFAGVYMLNGFTPSKISTDEVDRLIRDELNKDDIRSFARSEDGHVFYELSGADWTRVFDTRTSKWHRIAHHGLTRSRYGTHAFFGGRHVFGSYTENTLWASSPALFTEGGDNPINWEIVTPIVHMSPHRFRVNAIHIGALTGVGLVSGAAEDTAPVLLLDYSKDGGQTYAAQRECSLGAAAQRATRVKERAFGMFDHNGLSIRLQCSAAVMKGLQEIAIDVDQMAA